MGYFLFEVPSNLIMHRVGARAWIARIMITWGIISAAMAYIGPMANAVGIGVSAMFYIMRFLLGAAEAGFFPGIIFTSTTGILRIVKATLCPFCPRLNRLPSSLARRSPERSWMGSPMSAECMPGNGCISWKRLLPLSSGSRSFFI